MPSSSSSSSFIPVGSTVLVTGINGFLGARVALELLRSGYRVKGSLRSQSKGDAFLAALPSQHRDGVSFVTVEDIVRPGAYEASGALTGVSAVCHVASPTPKGPIEDNARQMLTPALDGTLNILRAAAASSAVKRVIVTSSVAAARDIVTPLGAAAPVHKQRIRETEWNPVTWEQGVASQDPYVVYSASKTLSERAAWDFMNREKPSFDLVTFCPPFFFGTSVSVPASAAEIASSLGTFFAALNGLSITPRGASTYIDIRDLAPAYASALQRKEAGNERFMLGGGEYKDAEITAMAANPDAAVAVSPATVDAIDWTKASRVLGFAPRSKQATFRDTAKFILEAKAHFPAAAV
jgi:nucleoside-diphosphate-sugar epimerase